MVYEYEKMMNKYNDYMSNCSEEEINEEKKRLLSKLKRVKYVSENGKVIKKISQMTLKKEIELNLDTKWLITIIVWKDFSNFIIICSLIKVWKF